MLNQTQRTQWIMIWSWLPPATRKGCNSSLSASQSLLIKDVGTCRQFSFSYCKLPEFYALSSGPPSQPHLHSLRSVLPERKTRLTTAILLEVGHHHPSSKLCQDTRRGPQRASQPGWRTGHCHTASSLVCSAECPAAAVGWAMILSYNNPRDYLLTLRASRQGLQLQIKSNLSLLAFGVKVGHTIILTH